MRIVVDVREYDSLHPVNLYQYGASEPLAMRIVKALRDGGHTVDAVWKGNEELVVDGICWWPWHTHPKTCDVLVACEWLVGVQEFEYDKLYVPLNKINPILSQKEDKVNGFAVFTLEHKRQLLFINPTIKEEQVFLIPPGVDVPELEWSKKVKHRLLWCNTPERGLVHLARAWPEFLKRVPDATIHLTYGLDRAWEQNKWLMDNLAQELAECKAWKRQYPDSVFDLGRVPHDEMQRVQCEAEMYPYPADAPLPGTVHAFVVMEAAAAGCALLLSRLEGLPEAFADCAEFLDIPIIDQEWAEKMAEILKNPGIKRQLGQRAREWAKTQPWSKHAELWNKLVEGTLEPCRQPVKV